jgi:threonylcarbamoyladenosine tRNA methylthiotransferase MtaB
MEIKTVACSTLGCKVNQYETSAIERLFAEKGYEITDFDHRADVYVINTCTVTHMGDRKSRQLIRRATRLNPDATIVVTGCYAQTAPGEIMDIPGVDIVVGTRDRAKIAELVEGVSKGEGPLNAVTDIMSADAFEELPPALLQNRVRAFLKIQEGCDNYCSYCIVPYARGPLRSRSMESILEETKKLLDQGYKEIVLTGIHTGAYGKDVSGELNLAVLVQRISGLDGLYRLRLSSLEPQDVDYGLIDVLASSPVVCRHLHLPLQSGDDRVLERMRRRYTTKHFSNIVERIRQSMPGAAITSDIMVGFPGETEENFKNSLNFVREIGFADLHVFKYSPRRGTAAASFANQVPAEIKEERSKRLMHEAENLRREFISSHVGKKLYVLVEQSRAESNNLYEGLTDNYIKVVFPAQHSLRGKLVEVLGEKITGDYLTGRII